MKNRIYQKKKPKLRQLIKLIEVSAYVCFGFSLCLFYVSHQLNNLGDVNPTRISDNSVLPERINLQTASADVDTFKNTERIAHHNGIIAKTSIPTKQNYEFRCNVLVHARF